MKIKHSVRLRGRLSHSHGDAAVGTTDRLEDFRDYGTIMHTGTRRAGSSRCTGLSRSWTRVEGTYCFRLRTIATAQFSGFYCDDGPTPYPPPPPVMCSMSVSGISPWYTTATDIIPHTASESYTGPVRPDDSPVRSEFNDPLANLDSNFHGTFLTGYQDTRIRVKLGKTFSRGSVTTAGIVRISRG